MRRHFQTLSLSFFIREGKTSSSSFAPRMHPLSLGAPPSEVLGGAGCRPACRRGTFE